VLFHLVGPMEDLLPYRARDVLRVPGLLSLCRLPLAAAFPVAALRPAWALGVLGAAAMTDVLDGWYARHFHQATRTGALLDGVMDKVFIASVLATLVVLGRMTPPELVILGTREIGELCLIAAALVGRPRPLGSTREAGALGKLATVLQFATIALFVVAAPYRLVALAATGACGAVAAAVYWRREWSVASRVS
jgi:CDP-diacylglycerol--glycerol-3-phosphate 3-phosphatidyltransferase/cardiolipin synthase